MSRTGHTPYEAVDPASWPYGDENGPPWADPLPGNPSGQTADTIDLRAFEIAKGEVKCASCHLVHRADVECW